MTETVVRCESLTRFYGRNRGVEDLTFEVRPGQVFGFLGPNGAGKTTTIRCLLGLLPPTSGRAFLFDREITLASFGAHSRIGYVPGDVALYPAETGRWTIDHVSGLRGRPPASDGELVERLQFDPSRKVKELSKGNKQKLALIVAFMHDPELLILDEPTSGLDPIVQQVIFDIIGERIDRDGATVLLSSHILTEVERVCDRVGVIREGRLVAEESTEEIIAKAIRTVRVTYETPVRAVAYTGIPGIASVEQIDERTIAAKVTSDLDGAVRGLLDRRISDIQVTHASLEEIFFQYYARNGEMSPGVTAETIASFEGERAADQGGAR